MGTNLRYGPKSAIFTGIERYVLIRREMGRDIDGACGQLRRQVLKNEE